MTAPSPMPPAAEGLAEQIERLADYLSSRTQAPRYRPLISEVEQARDKLREAAQALRSPRPAGAEEAADTLARVTAERDDFKGAALNFEEAYRSAHARAGAAEAEVERLRAAIAAAPEFRDGAHAFCIAAERTLDERLQQYKHAARDAVARAEAAEQAAARLREELAAIYAKHADVSQAWTQAAERADTLFAALTAAKERPSHD